MRRYQKKLSKRAIVLDGSTLEGGGQLIRNALCLSALTGKPLQIFNIRANRKGGGGLGNQHLACVKWLAHACQARVEGAEKGSRTLLFEPWGADCKASPLAHSPAFKKVMRDGQPWYECQLEMETAGSTALALQAILPFILCSELPSAIPIRLTLTGGTNVSASPSYEYISQVFLPNLRSIGFPRIEVDLHERRWHPGRAGIGSFTLEIPPREKISLPAFTLATPHDDSEEQRPRNPIHLQATFIGPTSIHPHFHKTLTSTIHSTFGETFSVGNGNVEITCQDSKLEKCLYCILVGTVPTSSNPTLDSPQPSTMKFGRDWLYDGRVHSAETSSTEMVEMVTKSLNEEISSGAAVDSFMCDQLVIFQALAQGRSIVSLGTIDGEIHQPSSHAQAAAWVASTILKANFKSGGICDGVGFGSVADGESQQGGDGLSVEQRLEMLGLA